MPEHLKHLSTGDLIAEMRDRGYRVYPHQRVRVFASIGSVSRRDQIRLGPGVNRLIEQVQRDAAMELGIGLWKSSAILKTVEDHEYGREYRGSVAIVLPRDFDYEREAWEVGHGERPHPES